MSIVRDAACTAQGGRTGTAPEHQVCIQLNVADASRRPSSCGVTGGRQQSVVGAVDYRKRGLQPQVAKRAVGAAKAAEYHRIYALPRESGVAHAVEPAHRCKKNWAIMFGTKKLPLHV